MSIREKITATVGETAMSSQGDKLDSKWLKSLKELTHNNSHTEALVEVAKYLETINPKHKHFVTAANKFLSTQNKQGYMTSQQMGEQYELYKKVKAALKKEVTSGQFRQIMACL